MLSSSIGECSDAIWQQENSSAADSRFSLAGDSDAVCHIWTPAPGTDAGNVPADDIDDVFNLEPRPGQVPVLSASGEISLLSAAAKEFKPGGGFSESTTQGQNEVGPGEAAGEDCWAGYDAEGLPPDETFRARDGLYSTDGLGPTGGFSPHDGFGADGVPREADRESEMAAEMEFQQDILECMADTFTDCSLECLQVALAKSDWDIDRASAAVLRALQAVCDPDRPSKPCRHFLEGECRRRDCMFSHDFSTTTCRYWLQSQCLYAHAGDGDEAAGGNGWGCLFLHDIDVPPLPPPAFVPKDGGGQGSPASPEIASNIVGNIHDAGDLKRFGYGATGLRDLDEGDDGGGGGFYDRNFGDPSIGDLQTGNGATGSRNPRGYDVGGNGDGDGDGTMMAPSIDETEFPSLASTGGKKTPTIVTASCFVPSSETSKVLGPTELLDGIRSGVKVTDGVGVCSGDGAIPNLSSPSCAGRRVVCGSAGSADSAAAVGGGAETNDANGETCPDGLSFDGDRNGHIVNGHAKIEKQSGGCDDAVTETEHHVTLQMLRQKHQELQGAVHDTCCSSAIVSNKGGNDGKKGGKGKKTRFTRVNMQALMQGAPIDQGGVGGGGPSLSTRQPSSSVPLMNQQHLVSSSSSSRLDGVASSAANAVAAAAAVADETLTTAGIQQQTAGSRPLSFADVVGSMSLDHSAPATSVTTISTNTSRNPRHTCGNSGGVAGGTTALSGREGGDGDRAVEAGPPQASAAAPTGRFFGEGRGSVEWVGTGETVSLQYESARKEAAELARARNKLFMAATVAFRRGQGLVARDLGRRGRELNLKMKEKHQQAAREIFAHRNPGDQVFRRRVLDLHGLHVSEATTVLDDVLQPLSQRGLGSVRVLAGSGHHSKGPTSKARLIPAVEQYCQARSIPYKRLPDQGTGHVGLIDIALTVMTSGQQTGGLSTSLDGHSVSSNHYTYS